MGVWSAVLFRSAATALILTVVLGSSGCGYNALQQQDESVKEAWSKVVSEYRRRAELIPNLLEAVKGAAAGAQPQLISGVNQAREAANSLGLTTDALDNPAAFARFQSAQSQLSHSLESLLELAHASPQLQADTNFQDLQSQLNGIEAGIAQATARYVDVVRGYNTTVRSFPTNLTARICDFAEKPSLAIAHGPLMGGTHESLERPLDPAVQH